MNTDCWHRICHFPADPMELQGISRVSRAWRRHHPRAGNFSLAATRSWCLVRRFLAAYCTSRGCRDCRRRMSRRKNCKLLLRCCAGGLSLSCRLYLTICIQTVTPDDNDKNRRVMSMGFNISYLDLS